MQWSMRWFEHHAVGPMCQDKAQSGLASFFDDEKATAIMTPQRWFPRAPPGKPVEKKAQGVLERLHSSMPGSPKPSPGLRRAALLWAAGQASPRFPPKSSLSSPRASWSGITRPNFATCSPLQATRSIPPPTPASTGPHGRVVRWNTPRPGRPPPSSSLSLRASRSAG